MGFIVAWGFAHGVRLSRAPAALSPPARCCDQGRMLFPVAEGHGGRNNPRRAWQERGLLCISLPENPYIFRWGSAAWRLEKPCSFGLPRNT